jgi:hypothetical protein
MKNNRKSETIAFGYWPRKVELHAVHTVIRPLETYDNIVEAMQQNERVANGWLYPPLVAAYDRALATKKQPRIYQRVFCTGSTHCLVMPRSATSRQLGEFLIALLGMLEGLRLLPVGWNHFYRAAIKLHSLSEVDCGRQDLEHVLAIAQVFWQKADAEVRRLMFGAIHGRLFSESYEHEFERFGGQYTVLDTCWNICERLDGNWWTPWSPKNKPGHVSRAKLLAKRYKMRVPSWAKTRKSRSKTKKSHFCKLSELRNNFFHEGLYGKTPTCFGYPKNFKGSIDFQLAAFNTRLILAILGVNCEYVRSSAETHCSWALDLD